MKMLTTLRVTALAVLSLSLVSCAGGPSFDAASLPPIPEGKGRVFVYRTSGFGAAVRPDVKIDGKVVGKSMARGFFHSDQPPGEHEISIQTEWKHKNTISVTAGHPTYVQCKVTMGLMVGHVIPNQVSAETGAAEIKSCKQGGGQ